jgi:TetR/AcrR family transcriptional regulator
MNQPAAPLSEGKLKILKAVATLLEDPTTKITINRISTQLSVTEAAIYRHYRSKEEILSALLGYMENHFLTPVNQAQKNSTDTYVRLKYVFDQYMEFLIGHPGLARLFLGHGNTEAASVSEKVQILNAKIRGQVALMLKWGQANNALKPGLTPDQAAELFYGLVVGAAMAQVFRLPQLPQAERWSAFAQAVLTQPVTVGGQP